MDLYELDPLFDIQVEYWSNQCQTFVSCNYLNPYTTNGENFISINDLSVSNEGNPCLILRFKNCTGNIIDLDEDKRDIEVTNLEQASSSVALSIDS